ncbi:MAG: ATPase, T2SS/T4P/T4SS family, partial [Patescibacteria group bacterium]
MPKFDEEKQQKRYEELREREAEDLARILSKKYRLPYLDLSMITIDLDSLKIIPEAEAREGRMAVFQSIGRKLQIAVLNPEREATKRILDDLKSKRFTCELFLVSETSLEKAFSRYPEIPVFTEAKEGIVDISPSRLESFQIKVKGTKTLKELLGIAASAKEARRISEVLEMLLAGALALEASDIHLEPGEKGAHVRFRLDGVLQDVVAVERGAYQLLVSRIKLLSEMKLNVKDRAQD